MKKFLFPLILLLASSCLASVTVRIGSPTGSTLSSPISLQASASSSFTITAWHAYLDGNDVFKTLNTSSISTTLNATTGTHTLLVRAWDSSGAYGSQTVQFTVSTTSEKPVVSISSPGNNATTGSPLQVKASASSSHAITGWHAYLDGQDVYRASNTNSISTSISPSKGTHMLLVRAWDSTGAYGDDTVQFTVGTTSATTNPLPTPPSYAKVFNNIDQMSSGWGKCKTTSCAGGSGAGNYWQAFFQTSPSLDGSSMEFYRDGIWGNALWWKKFGANNGAHHFLWDFYFRVDSASWNAAQALEFDSFQFVGGYNYMMGTQCDYGLGVWDVWNGTDGHWSPTSIPCPKMSPNTWHHAQLYTTTNHSNHSYTFVTLVVDGKAYNMNKTMYAKYLAWGDNVGTQWQLDVNATGNGFHEWVDKAKLTIW